MKGFRFICPVCGFEGPKRKILGETITDDESHECKKGAVKP